MKKKLLTLLLVCVMALSVSLVAFAADSNTISASDAIQAVKEDNAFIIDVRSNTARANVGTLDYLGANVLYLQLFDEGNKLDTDDAINNATAFTNYVTATDNKAKLEAKPIYILCNSGSRGAVKASELLADAGYTNYATITGGANGIKDLETRYSMIGGNEAVSGFKALELVEKGEDVILDVRNNTNYGKGHVAGSIHVAVFDETNTPAGTADDPLAQAFIAATRDNAKLKDKQILVLCNGGARGARAATVLLKDAGYSLSDIHTITSGAKDADIQAAATYASGAFTVEKLTDSNYLVLDVRSAGRYAAGHLKGSLSLPVFAEDNSLPDDLAKAFSDYVAANKATFEGKTILVICNSGARGAVKATELLKAAEYTNVFTVEGGAKDAAVKAAATYVSGEFTVEKLTDSNYLVLDVRSAEKYAAGHLKGSLSLPVFDKDNQLPDDLAKAFSDYVAANKATFEGKTILVICNSGARGAVKATELLKAAGYTNVFIVENGAKSAIKDSFVIEKAPTKPTSPQTGDPANDVATVSPMMVVAFVMVATVIAFARKREYTK